MNGIEWTTDLAIYMETPTTLNKTLPGKNQYSDHSQTKHISSPKKVVRHLPKFIEFSMCIIHDEEKEYLS